jgi:Fe-S-cluster-containing dehydrogenase component
MPERVLLIDVDKCVGCYACEVACKQENGLDLSSRWCLVTRVGPRKIQDSLHMDFVTGVCIHCDVPACSLVCPTGAIFKREDGIVIICEEKCTGCGLCVHGCPYGVIYQSKEGTIPGKCSLCVDRVDQGLEPSCVQHCISGSLQFVDREGLDEITHGMHVAGSSKVRYLSSKWELLCHSL